MNFGSPVWKKPSTTVGGNKANQVCQVAPTDSAYNVFMGSLVRRGETDGNIPVSQDQIQLIRCMGPLSVLDSVGKSPTSGADYLTKDGNPLVGTALEAISDTSVKVIQVRIGVSGSGRSGPVRWG